MMGRSIVVSAILFCAASLASAQENAKEEAKKLKDRGAEAFAPGHYDEALANFTGRAFARTPEDPREQAKRLKDEGARALDRGEYEAALHQFEQAYAIFPSPNLRFNIGLALAKLGRDLEAVQAFEAFLSEAKDAPADARAFAGKQIEELDRRLGHLVVHCVEARVDIAIDAKPAGTTPLVGTIRVAPGEHDVLAKKAGFEPLTLHVTVGVGQTRQVELQLRRVQAAGSEGGEPPGDVRRTWAIVAGGVAVAAIVVGAIYGLDAFSTWDDAQKRCPGNVCPNPADVSIGQDADRDATISTISFLVGGAALVTGAVLWWTGRAPGEERASAFRIAPLVGEGSAGMIVTGRF